MELNFKIPPATGYSVIEFGSPSRSSTGLLPTLQELDALRLNSEGNDLKSNARSTTGQKCLLFADT